MLFADGTVTRWNTTANVEINSASGYLDLTANTDMTLGLGGNFQLNATAGSIGTFSFGAGGTTIIAQAGPITLETITSGGVTGDIDLTPQAAAYVRLNNRTRATSSLRVGSGTTLAGFDGTDGAIVADSALAIILAKDRSSINYFGWYEDTTIRLLSSQTGNLWDINATTGVVTQSAWNNLTYAGTWATLAGGAPLAYRVLKPSGLIELRGVVTGGAAITIAAAQIPAAARPLGSKPLNGIYYNGTIYATTPIYVNTAGDVVAPALAGGVGANFIMLNGTYPVD